jgi:hypothetical protein
MFAVAMISILSLTAESAVMQKPDVKQQQTENAPVTGELVSVDDKAKTFAVKTSSEGEVKFSYSDKTEIVGADTLVSGLAGTGSEVTVHYDSHGTAKVAMRIEIKPRK